MHSFNFNAATIALLSTLAVPADAYWRMMCPGILTTGRVDPIVSPNKVSSHTHVVVGGNGFAPNMDYASTQKSTCTSCSIKGDNSNYWIPSLFYQTQDHKFELVPIDGATVYYQQRASYPGKTIKAFPEGFRMTAGNPALRTGGNSEAQQAVDHVCLDYSGSAPVPEEGKLPPVPCPDGVRAQVYFPSCWDGVNLDSANHQDHMAYPSNYNSGVCPSSHPQPVISIFYEFIFNTGSFKWYSEQQPFVYAMGDNTGYGLHGDFVNGWDVNILQHGIDTFTTMDAGDAGNVYYDDIFGKPDVMGTDCALPSLVDENITGILDKLPGCNPVTDTPTAGTCDSTATLGVQTSSVFTDVTKTKGFEYLGCGTDVYNARVLPYMAADSKTMTVESCIDMCTAKGYTIAGLEYSTQCFCGNSISTSAAPKAGAMGSCNMPCGGNANEKCGDAQKLSLYQKCNGACQNANYGLVGQVGSIGTGSTPTAAPVVSSPHTVTSVVSSPPALRTITVIPVPANTQVASISATTSSPGGYTAGSTAKPGPNTKPSPVSSTKSPSSTTTKTISPIAQATPATPATASGVGLPQGWKAVGCYGDTKPVRVLRGIDMAWWGVPITSSNCAAYCDSKGFSIAGTEWGQQCFCGNSLNGASPKAASQCRMPCLGDSKQMCGGDLTLSIFMKSNSVRRRAHLNHHIEAVKALA